jgi:hypothetical protein
MVAFEAMADHNTAQITGTSQSGHLYAMKMNERPLIEDPNAA